MDEIAADIEIMVSGHFTADALSPEVYDAILARAAARADEYLDVFERLFLGPDFDALAQSDLYLPTFLAILARTIPDRVRATAARLLRGYDVALIAYDEGREEETFFELLSEDTINLLRRLDVRRRELRGLAR
jgi:hypothetical protein